MLTLAEAIDRGVAARNRAFARRDELSVTAKLALTLGMACVTGLSAQLRLPLPNTVVPVTGQVFVVLLGGVLLGATYGTLSQVFYVAIGAVGMPWFNGWAGGPAMLLGYTGGYLVGFIPAVMLVGILTQRFASLRRPAPMCAVMLLGVGVIYLAGALQFAALTHQGLTATLAQTVVPFVAWDVAKALLAANIGAALLPKSSPVR